MPEAERPWAETVPNQFQHLTFLHAALRHSSRRSYRSLELPPPSPQLLLLQARKVKRAAARETSYAVLQSKITNMLASHMGSSNGTGSQPQGEASAGDFDQTPAPSARPSMAQIRADDNALVLDEPYQSKDLMERPRPVRVAPGAAVLADSASNSSTHHSRMASAVLPDSVSERSRSDHENHA